MTDTKKSLVQDILGSLLFVVGAFLAVSIGMFWREGGAPRNPNFSTSIVVTSIEIAGLGMGFLFGLTAAMLGGFFFFAQSRVAVLRHVAGALGVWLGLTLIVGAISPEGAGSLGRLFTSLLGASLVASVTSACVGLFVAAATVWGAWAPKSNGISTKLGEPNPVSAALREGDEGGVTSAEAAALLPLDENEEPIVPAHPIDVRLKGGIPEGTFPIESESTTEPFYVTETNQSHTETGRVPAPVDVVHADTAHADLAAPAVEAVGSDHELRGGAGPRAGAAPSNPAPVRKAAGSAAPVATPIPASHMEDLQRPSWEVLAEEEYEEPAASASMEDVDEPVVELQPARAPAAKAPASDESEFSIQSEPEFDWGGEEEASEAATATVEPAREVAVASAEPAAELDEEESEESLEDVEASAEEAEVADDEVDDEAEEETEDESEEEADDEEADDEEADDDEEEWEYEDEEEVDEDDPEAEYEEWEEDVDEEEEEDDEEYEDAEEGEEEDDEEEEDDDEAGEEDEEEDEDEVEDDDEEELAEAEEEEVLAEADEEPAQEADELEEEEPEVVVQPASKAKKRPNRRARRDAKSTGEVPEGGAEREQLLHRAGHMIIESNRVAVSMFQREFDLSFQKATLLLDELQERGLIGPYLGGRHRDILLTREQWDAKAPSS